MLVALRAVDLGLRIYFLGPNLPADEIIGAARRSGVAAVGLSVVNPENGDNALEELRRLEQQLPAGIELWLGGGDARRLASRGSTTKALVLDEPDTLEFNLRRLRTVPQPGRA
jgi:hypothetical protein